MSSVASPAYPSLKSLLIATDLSETSHKSLRHAFAIARHYGAKIYVAYIVSDLAYPLAETQVPGIVCAAAETEVQQLEHDLFETGGLDGLEHEFLVGRGIVWEELQSVISQERIDLLVLGTCSQPGIKQLTLGSVAQRVFRDATCLVLTVGPNSYPFDSSRTSLKFLFSTDFRESSLRALPYAISFANQFRAKLTLLHVVPAARIPAHPAGGVQLMRNNARMACVRQLEHLQTEGPEGAPFSGSGS
jgi:nucleotide-binding universal stress UspA family protein